MPRRPRPVSRQPPKDSISIHKGLKQRPLPPKLVATLKSRVEENSGSSEEEAEDEEDHPEAIGAKQNDSDDEEDADAPRISQWVDDDEDFYQHVNDEPVRPSVHHSSCEYLTSMQRLVEEGGHSSIHHCSGSDSQHLIRPGIGTLWRASESKTHVR
jgi:hypothetical protein